MITTAQGPEAKCEQSGHRGSLDPRTMGIEVRMQETKSQSENRKGHGILRPGSGARKSEANGPSGSRRGLIGGGQRPRRSGPPWKEGIVVDHQAEASWPLTKHGRRQGGGGTTAIEIAARLERL